MLNKALRLLKEYAFSKKDELNCLIKNKEYIKVKFFVAEKNWGDELNLYIIAKLSDKMVVHCPLGEVSHVLGIGSILSSANSRSVVWGSGFIRENQTVKSKPARVQLLRGPLTRKVLCEQGVESPEVYGDPGVLISRLYSPNVKKKYRLGVVPHYKDKNCELVKGLALKQDVKVIDIQQDIESFVDDVVSCENIVSSSLHGMICADSYFIPNARLIVSDKVAGGRFKFDDYHQGVGIVHYNTLDVRDSKGLDVETLISACEKESIKSSVFSRIEESFHEY